MKGSKAGLPFACWGGQCFDALRKNTGRPKRCSVVHTSSKITAEVRVYVWSHSEYLDDYSFFFLTFLGTVFSLSKLESYEFCNPKPRKSHQDRSELVPYTLYINSDGSRVFHATTILNVFVWTWYVTLDIQPVHFESGPIGKTS